MINTLPRANPQYRETVHIMFKLHNIWNSYLLTQSFKVHPGPDDQRENIGQVHVPTGNGTLQELIQMLAVWAMSSGQNSVEKLLSMSKVGATKRSPFVRFYETLELLYSRLRNAVLCVYRGPPISLKTPRAGSSALS